MNVGVVGLGLIGGSLCKAFKDKEIIKYITAADASLESINKALADGVIDYGSQCINESFGDCDVIFLCTPVSYIKDYIKTVQAFAKKGCIVTDVGSTKASVVETAAHFNHSGFIFIGGHPMTGSEKSGYDNSKDILFENAYYILTPSKNTPIEKVDELSALVSLTGAIPIVADPDKHDYIMACISHVPHIAASSLVHLVKKKDGQDKLMFKLAAGGFKDITRIASSSPVMWADISFDNKRQMFDIIDDFIDILQYYKQLVMDGDYQHVKSFLAQGKEYRDSFVETAQFNEGRKKELFVDIRDVPGNIAKVAAILATHNINIKNIGIVNNREFENGALHIVFETSSDTVRSRKLLESLGYNI